jgi:hypothetical protein
MLINKYLKNNICQVKDKYIFKCNNFKDEIKWKKPNECYHQTEELICLFEGIEEVYFIDNQYNSSDINIKIFNINDTLIINQGYYESFENSYVIFSDYHGNHKRGINRFNPYSSIKYLKEIITNITPEKFNYLWNYLIPFHYLVYGEIQSSSRQGFPEDSTETKSLFSFFGKILIENKWIAGKDHQFYKPSEISYYDIIDDIDKDSLDSQKLAEKLGMKVDYIKEDDAMKALGINDKRHIELVKKINILPENKKEEFYEKQKELYYSIENSNKDKLEPISIPNSARRKESVAISHINNPTKNYEIRPRSVRTSSPPDDIKEYLEYHYSTSNQNILICQLCKNEMPFKYNDKFHIEAVQIFDKKTISKEVKEQYIALCPNCASKYQLLKNNSYSVENIIKQILNSNPQDSEELIYINIPDGININPIDKTVIFQPKHLLDVKTILEEEEKAKTL